MKLYNVFALLVLTTSSTTAAVVVVSGDSNIFGAGHATPPAAAGGGVGTLPPSIDVDGGSFYTSSVSGLVTYNGGGNFYGADGGLYLGGSTDMNSVGGISGIKHGSRTMFLIGVFTNGTEPTGGGPPMLDFSVDSFASVSPLLNQTFFMGDGLTGTGTGSVQLFLAPSGATRLFLGFADGNDFA